MSVLPMFSKLFERVIDNRLLNVLNKLSLLFKNQFGFTGKNHSTSLALIQVNTLLVFFLTYPRLLVQLIMKFY